ncbi:hypothetical protein [Streptomyces sp. NPDC059076]|uniref:hypothetical protein n=1 Tax=unclassified Streptomyces TaxID=2593676 RepID=UPI0036C9DA3D
MRLPPLLAEGPVTVVEMQTWRPAWEQAESAATALREALTRLGLSERLLRSIAPVVGKDGQAYVRVGRALLDSTRSEEIAEGIRTNLPNP